MKKLSYIGYFLIGIIFIITSCSENGEKNVNSLPKARGAESEVIVVMDSSKWAGEVGTAVRETFSSAIPGLPQNEPELSLKHVSPLKFNGYLKHATNILFVTTLNNDSREGRRLRSYFTEESIRRIQENPGIFKYTSKNEYARGQQLLHLFGRTDQQLINNIEENQKNLREFFLTVEKRRMAQKIFSGQNEKGITRRLQNEHDFSLRIPAEYKVAKERENFVWIRNFTPDIDKNIIVYYTDYTSEEVFEDQGIFDLRKDIANSYLVDIEDTSIYMTTETLVPLHTEKVNFNGKYAVETRGLWRLSDSSLGGPFLSYVFVDEKLNRLYYLEGYVASPGKNKRQSIRELETILWTFKTEEELKANSKS